MMNLNFLEVEETEKAKLDSGMEEITLANSATESEVEDETDQRGCYDENGLWWNGFFSDDGEWCDLGGNDWHHEAIHDWWQWHQLRVELSWIILEKLGRATYFSWVDRTQEEGTSEGIKDKDIQNVDENTKEHEGEEAACEKRASSSHSLCAEEEGEWHLEWAWAREALVERSIVTAAAAEAAKQANAGSEKFQEHGANYLNDDLSATEFPLNGTVTEEYNQAVVLQSEGFEAEDALDAPADSILWIVDEMQNGWCLAAGYSESWETTCIGWIPNFVFRDMTEEDYFYEEEDYDWWWEEEAQDDDWEDGVWIRCLDEYGNVYYFNSETEETQWFKPGEEPPPMPVEVEEGDAVQAKWEWEDESEWREAIVVDKIDDGRISVEWKDGSISEIVCDSGNVRPEGWEYALAEAYYLAGYDDSGGYYDENGNPVGRGYYDENNIWWPEESDSGGYYDENGYYWDPYHGYDNQYNTGADGVDHESNEEDGQESEDDWIDGVWVRCADELGSTYYFNTETEESQWHRPGTDAPAEDSPIDSYDGVSWDSENYYLGHYGYENYEQGEDYQANVAFAEWAPDEDEEEEKANTQPTQWAHSAGTKQYQALAASLAASIVQHDVGVVRAIAYYDPEVKANEQQTALAKNDSIKEAGGSLRELKLRENDLFRILHQQEDGWWYGQRCRGTAVDAEAGKGESTTSGNLASYGWLPSTYVEWVEEIGEVVAIAEYKPEDGAELQLELKEGQVIRVLQQEESGWWHGLAENGHVGWFPSTFTEWVGESTAVVEMKADSDVNDGRGVDFAPQELDSGSDSSSGSDSESEQKDHQFLVGDTIEARFKGKKQWFIGRVIAVEQGSYDIAYEDGDREDGVPSNFVRKRTKLTAEALRIAEYS
jgi:hypothetical protein